MDTLAIWLILVYSVLIIIGGIVGYTRAKSMPSLIAGVVSGVLLLVAFGYSLSNRPMGLLIATILAVALFSIFLSRYRKTGKLMPSGVMMGVSILMAVIFIAGMVTAMLTAV